MRLGIFLLLCVAIAAPALAVDVKGYQHHGVPGPRDEFACDDGWLDNAYYENQGYVYGNAFNVGAGGLLQYVDFWHFGWYTWSGPSQYNLHIFDDGTCTELNVLGPFTADDAYSQDVEEIEDLTAYGVTVSGQVGVLLEPLSCAAPNDCYPDVYFDQTGNFDGCDRLFPLSAPSCAPYMNGDFVFRIGVTTEVPAQNVSWGSVKALYR